MLNVSSSVFADVTLGSDNVVGIMSGSGQPLYVKPWGVGMQQTSYEVLQHMSSSGTIASASAHTLSVYGQSGQGWLLPNNHIVRQNWDETRLYFVNTDNDTGYTSSWTSGVSFRTGGVVIARTGYMYCKNFKDGAGLQHFIKFDPANVRTSAAATTWIGGTDGTCSRFDNLAVGVDGNLYSISNNINSKMVLKLDPLTDTVSFISASGITVGGARSYAVSHPDGKIYYANAGGAFGSYDPVTQTHVQISTSIGTGDTGSPNAMQVGPDGNIYYGTRTANAKRFVITGSFAVQSVGGGAGPGQTIGGCFGADGRFYIIPFWYDNAKWYGYNIWNNTYITGSYPRNRGGGAVLHPSGVIYSVGITNVNHLVKIFTYGVSSSYGYLKSPLQHVAGT